MLSPGFFDRARATFDVLERLDHVRFHGGRLGPADDAQLRRRWTAYLAFYDAEVAAEVYDTTFARLLGGVLQLGRDVLRDDLVAVAHLDREVVVPRHVVQCRAVCSLRTRPFWHVMAIRTRVACE